MSRAVRTAVRLVEVDEDVLAALVELARTDAAADDVTPRITGGSDWTKARTDWFCRYHRGRRAGLSGSAGEQTWAVDVDGRVAGAVRLSRTRTAGVLEIGLWLARGMRGSGNGRRAIAATLEEAAKHGARTAMAESTADNAASLALMETCGFTVVRDKAGNVRATLNLPEAS